MDHTKEGVMKEDSEQYQTAALFSVIPCSATVSMTDFEMGPVSWHGVTINLANEQATTLSGPRVMRGRGNKPAVAQVGLGAVRREGQDSAWISHA